MEGDHTLHQPERYATQDVVQYWSFGAHSVVHLTSPIHAGRTDNLSLDDMAIGWLSMGYNVRNYYILIGR